MTHKATWNGCEIYLFQGDITTMAVDAIVNAANPGLGVGGGVCGAIHGAAGPRLIDECRVALSVTGMLNPGDVVITPGFNLKAKHVIHTVGPHWYDDPLLAPSLLATCYRRSLWLLRGSQLHSIAFPCISTGVYGFPFEAAALVAIRAVKDSVEQHGEVGRVIFCCYESTDHQAYEAELSRLAVESAA